MGQPIPPVIARACRVMLAVAIIGNGLLALAVVEMVLREGVPRVAFSGMASFRAERVLSGNLNLDWMGAEVGLDARTVSTGFSLAVQGGGRLRIGDSYSAFGSAQVAGDLPAGLLRVGGSLDIDPGDAIRTLRRHRIALYRAGLPTSSVCRDPTTARGSLIWPPSAREARRKGAAGGGRLIHAAVSEARKEPFSSSLEP